MTKEEAIKTIESLSGLRHEPWLVDALVKLGLLKLDTPESVHNDGCDFIATMLYAWAGDSKKVSSDMRKAGYQVTKT